MLLSLAVVCFFFFVPFLSTINAGAEQSKTVPLCGCPLTETCASKGAGQLDNCKEECSTWLASYSNPNPKQVANTLMALTDCFMKDAADLDAVRVTKCMKGKINNFCAKSDQEAMSKVLTPDYNQWMELASNSTETEEKSLGGGTFIRKARSAFRIFRNFQKCMNNCAKRHSTECFQNAGCAITLPTDRNTSASIYNECTSQNVHRDARESCRCLIQNHKVHQLIGVCPLMSNTYLMRML